MWRQRSVARQVVSGSESSEGQHWLGVYGSGLTANRYGVKFLQKYATQVCSKWLKKNLLVWSILKIDGGIKI